MSCESDLAFDVIKNQLDKFYKNEHNFNIPGSD
jgi:hypothetical protein